VRTAFEKKERPAKNAFTAYGWAAMKTSDVSASYEEPRMQKR